MWNSGSFGKKRQGKPKMKPTAVRDLLAQKCLKKDATFEQDLAGQFCLPYASDKRIARPGALSDFKKALATLLDKVSGVNLAGANPSAGSTKEAPGKNLFKTLRPPHGARFHSLQQGQFSPCHIGLSKGCLVNRAHTHALAAALAFLLIAVIIHDCEKWGILW
jgi:hypothetical protein